MNAFRSTNCNTYLLIFSHIRRFMSGTRHSNRSQDRTTSASCSACQKQLNSLETGSGICHSCSELYCSECSSNTSNSTIICNRCTVLQSNQANWDSVMRLSVRDLKWFMRRRNIPSVGLIEKEQFVKAVLRSLGINTRSPNTGYHTCVESTLKISMNLDAKNVWESKEVNILIENSVDSTKYRVKLEDLVSEESIESLSVRQIKDLLVYNFVDFTHCVEKTELITRAKELWRNHKQQNDPTLESQKAVECKSDEKVGSSKEKLQIERYSDEISDECGVCMEAPVNCVFLECGHLFSCVDCGRKLTECPICRQTIVRIVRTFRV